MVALKNTVLKGSAIHNVLKCSLLVSFSEFCFNYEHPVKARYSLTNFDPCWSSLLTLTFVVVFLLFHEDTTTAGIVTKAMKQLDILKLGFLRTYYVITTMKCSYLMYRYLKWALEHR